jgi:trans-2,3-dihydro-3-hydroxyanthranilate isomerase
MTAYRYLHYDVFTGTRFEGNPLAVLPDARGLTAQQMQAIAREMAFSETTFVLPPEQDGTDARVRIFTPTQELPMAGHPTVGTTFALVHEGVLARGQERFMCGLEVGPTPVDLAWDGDRLASAWMTQRVPEFGATFESPELRAEIARAVGLDVADLLDGCPVQLVSSGVPFAFIPLRSREAVDRAEPQIEASRRLEREHGLDHTFVFSTEPGTPDATVYSRMFAPVLGIMEDPATGGATGPLGGYLLRYGLVSPEQARAMVSLQGHAMGRPSWLHMEVHGTPERIERVRVGGESVLVATGTLEA